MQSAAPETTGNYRLFCEMMEFSMKKEQNTYEKFNRNR